jgi:hypothetical protein
MSTLVHDLAPSRVLSLLKGMPEVEAEVPLAVRSLLVVLLRALAVPTADITILAAAEGDLTKLFMATLEKLSEDVIKRRPVFLYSKVEDSSESESTSKAGSSSSEVTKNGNGKGVNGKRAEATKGVVERDDAEVVA